MDRFTDKGYLKEDQYRDSSNLDARFRLHELFSTNEYGWLPWVFDQFDLPPKCAILDVGCGPGYLWYENADRIPEDWDVTLTDLSVGMVCEARQRISANQRSWKFAVVDAQAIPFPDECFDAVIANHMLYHVPDRQAALSEIRRVLKPGGRFYASTVGQAHLQEMGDLVRRFDPAMASESGSFSSPFLLENGRDQIRRWFSGVRVCRYEDALIVTEAKPLIAYMLSGIGRDSLVGDKREPFAEFVRRELAISGLIYITKDSGVFESVK